MSGNNLLLELGIPDLQVRWRLAIDAAKLAQGKPVTPRAGKTPVAIDPFLNQINHNPMLQDLTPAAVGVGAVTAVELLQHRWIEGS